MTTSITTRAGKGSPLTHDEVDANFTNLQTTADAALPLAGGTLTGPVTMTGGTVTTSTPLIDATQTWNAAGVTFTGWKLNVTDTASAAGSLLADWQVGGASKAYLNKSGVLTFVGNDATKIQIGDASVLFLHQTGLSGHGSDALSGALMIRNHLWTKSTILSVEAGNNTLSLGNSTDAQTFYVVGTYTDSSNYVRASLAATSTTVTLAAETAGTGADNIDVTLTPAGTGVVASGSPIKTQSTTVASLMSAATAGSGARAFVTDATATTFLSTVAGGGANKVPVVSDGTNWLIG